MPGRLETIQRFPVKGLSAEPLERVTLTPGDGVPGDRMYGFARHGSGFDPAAPKPLPKDKFVVLLTQAALAGLATRFDPSTAHLTLTASGVGQTFDMNGSTGREAAARWLAEYLDLTDAEPPQFVSAAPHRFTDVSVVSPQMMNAVSILNRASVADLETRLDVPIAAARFRANLELDGVPPWWELDHVGGLLQIGDVVLRILKRTQRCAATEVNPETAERDLRLPYLLRKEMGHLDMGVYAEVVNGGTIMPGQAVDIQAAD